MNFGAVLRAALGLPLAVALGGCASLPFFAPKDANGESAAAAPAPGIAQYRLEVVAPAPLDKLLGNYLDLARFQNAPQGEGITGVELDRLAAAAPAQARTLLETEGYFNAGVRVERSAEANGAPLVRIVVSAGPQALVSEASLEARGALEAAAQAGDAAAQARIASLQRAWPLQPGKPFRQTAWTEAKSTILAQMRAEGYPAAAWASTAVQVDAERNSVRLALVADSGPLYRLGPVRVEGIERYDAEAVRQLATFQVGTPYSEKLLLDFQERIVKTGLFEGASVELDADAATATAAPVLVKVKELSLQQATLGLGYSANTGPRVTLEHFHRRVFGSRWIAHNKFELGPDLKSFGTEFISYPLEGQYRNLVAANGERLRSADELRTSWTGRLGRTQDMARIERLIYAEALHARVDSAALVTSADALSANTNWVLRDVDSVLLPTQGITLNAQAALGYGSGQEFLPGPGLATESKGPFVRAYGRLTWYKPLGAAWYGAVRVEAGEVFVRSRIGVPDPLLFRAGGDDSVRGYGYRTLGPVINGAIASGRVLATASAEVARPISPRYPALWWAVFVDAGNAADRWIDLDPVVGYGVGLRWRSPVGPLRADIAYGEAERRFRLHLSVGIAF
ncbi:MAG TPA: BamA/TamA family outer membrane protein [Caldimonas sp.]